MPKENHMMKKLSNFWLFVAASLFVTATAEAASVSKPERIAIWESQVPNGDGTFDGTNAYITVHRPEKPNGAVLVICPGGGYGGLVTSGEGHGIAKWLNQHGIIGVVLEYRLPRGRPLVPLLDAQRAIRTVRSQAGELGCDPKRIGIVGFSAGGHLASTAATHFDLGEAKSSDPIARMSCRPDFAILIYPVISMGPKGHGGSRNNLLGKEATPANIELFSNEKQVTAQTPPCFLAHALDDRVVDPVNSQMFFDALEANKVAAKYLKIPTGGHGLNGYKGPGWDAWQAQSLQWLAELNIIPKDAVQTGEQK